jgi:hypothetical protein
LFDPDVCVLAGMYQARTHAPLVFLGKWERNDVWDWFFSWNLIRNLIG